MQEVFENFPEPEQGICRMVQIWSSERRTKTAAVATVTRDIDFVHFWRELAAVGWKTKPSTGLEDRWKYISPDGSQVFLGEDEVVTYALQVGLLDTVWMQARTLMRGGRGDVAASVDVRASEDVVTREDEDVVGIHENVVARDNEDMVGSHEEVAGSVCDSIRASQINTSVVMSQNTIHELFGPESDSEDDDFLQYAVARALDLSQSDILYDASQHEAAASLQLLSKVRAMWRNCFYPVCHEAGCEFQFESGASDDEVDADSDDKTPDRGVVEEDDVSSEDDVVQMDEAFVRSLQVGNGALDKRSKKLREDALRGMDWTLVSSEFEGDATQPYPGLNMEEARPVAALRCVSFVTHLYSYIYYFLPKSLWCKHTNRNKPIWHDDFRSGQAIPTNLGKRVVLRRPGQEAGASKKTRRELQLRESGAGGDDEMKLKLPEDCLRGLW
ncbi:hypothetical protein GQ600_23612 [Phytophthora cactorum]|nr:hypothetical protein GQ600_23612 [Phytophthora cactorum]